MHNHTPNIQRLAIHLPNQQTVTFRDGQNLQYVVNNATARKTTLTAWFQENLENVAAHEYKYIDFPCYYTWNKKQCKWNLRKTATRAIGRLYMEACILLNLLEDDTEWDICLHEGKPNKNRTAITPSFCNDPSLLSTNSTRNIMENHKLALCEDIYISIYTKCTV
ncbi:unnamed protein product [Rhizophagus irregularis]|nr:unnamed protein product [Rhizophagus irregularis]